MKKVYVAEDGEKFYSEEKCLEHENILEPLNCVKVTLFKPNSNKTYDFSVVYAGSVESIMYTLYDILGNPYDFDDNGKVYKAFEITENRCNTEHVVYIMKYRDDRKRIHSYLEKYDFPQKVYFTPDIKSAILNTISNDLYYDLVNKEED